ncbi:MAG: glycosyltransferase family 4 protein [Deltaproteobacteria bacterium]|nr:glycosyltransferase family 4 protein [Deltaproteobacteria bacterium]
MKLALIRKRYTDFGGAERYVSGLARRLADQGHEVHILAREWKVERAEGLIFDPIPKRRGPSFLSLLAFARDVARKVQSEKFDLVHSFDRTYSQDIFRAGDGCHIEWLSRRARAFGRGSALLDKLNPRHMAFLHVEARLFADPRLKLILTNSKRGREEIIRHYGVPGNKIRVVYNGVDRERFTPGLREKHREQVRQDLGLTYDEPIFLFVGSGFKIKGLFSIIQVLPILEGKLLVAGRDRIKPYLSLARRLGVEDRVIFLGSRHDVERLYGAADVFVLPSLYELFSNACLEAMAAGLPVVTTDETGAAEVIRNGLNGYTVGFPVKIDELAEKISRSLKIDRAGLLEANERLLEPFDWDKNLEQTLEAYNAIQLKGS